MKSFKGNGWTVTTGENISLVVHDIKTLPGFEKFHDVKKTEEFFTMCKHMTFAELEEAMKDYHEYICRGNGWTATFDGPHFQLRKNRSGEIVWQYENASYIKMPHRRKLDIQTILDCNHKRTVGTILSMLKILDSQYTEASEV